MIFSVAAAFGDRHGRVFFSDRTAVESPETLIRSLGSRYLDAEDASRDQLLRELLRTPIVEGTAHPGVDPSDVFHVYLNPPSGSAPLFACTIVTEERLEFMLREAPVVFENFCLQIASGPHLTDAAIRAAVESWAARNYPDLAPAQFHLLPWIDEESSDGLDLLLTSAATAQLILVGGSAPHRRLRPNPGLPHPALPRRAA